MMYNSELRHFGILGMKWGIRRFQNPDGTLTEAGKKRYGTQANLERRLGNQFYKSSEVQIIRNKDGSKTYPKGYILNRLANDDAIINGSGAMYVSEGKDDAARYIEKHLPYMEMSRSYYDLFDDESSVSMHHLVVEKDLTVPSAGQLTYYTSQFLKKNPDFFYQFKGSQYERTFSQGSGREFSKETLKKIIESPTGEESFFFMMAANNSLGNPDHYDQSKKYYKYLISQGINAIPDMEDRMSLFSRDPLIIIDPSAVKVESKTEMTKDVVKAGQEWAKKVPNISMSDVLKDLGMT